MINDHVIFQSYLIFWQYGYVQRIPRPPTDIEVLAEDDVTDAFTEFALHVISHQQRGEQVPDNQPWAHTRGYMRCNTPNSRLKNFIK